jgi:ubiquinone/menaquinone biosynthesis C-methylase UbiE
MSDQPRETAEYALGYSEREKQRLVLQARIFGDQTERLFRMAGIEPGMSVLDVGCGVGDVSLLAAAIVGPTGSVLSVDRATDSIETARERARSAGLEDVAFEAAELLSLDPGRTFDALVGRLVLMYLPDPAATLAHLLKFIRPDGIVVFQEMELSLARSMPPLQLFETCLDRIRETFRRAGFEIDMGSRLFSTYQRAGLPRPEMRLEGRMQGGSGAPAYELLAETVRSLMPMMERLGVATSSEIDVDTLAARLEAEACAGGGVVMPPPMIGAWARKPAD